MTGRSEPRRWRGGGVLGSLLLHAALFILVFWHLPWPAAAPERVMPINLVRLADVMAFASNGTVAAPPRERAPEAATMPALEAVPLAGSPPREAAEQLGAPRSLSPLPAIPKAVKAAPKAPAPAARVQRAPSPEESLVLQLKTLSRLSQPAPPVPSQPSQQDGVGWSNVTAAGTAGSGARRASYSVKDLIRAEVERRWHPRSDPARPADWTVAIHIRLDEDGTVNMAEIVTDPRLGADKIWQDFARGARNAVFMSSPILLPLDARPLARDVVVDFDPRRVSQ